MVCRTRNDEGGWEGEWEGKGRGGKVGGCEEEERNKKNGVEDSQWKGGRERAGVVGGKRRGRAGGSRRKEGDCKCRKKCTPVQRGKTEETCAIDSHLFAEMQWQTAHHCDPWRTVGGVGVGLM